MSWQCICSACGFFIQGHTTSRVCTPRPIIEFHLSMGSTSSQAPGFHPKHIDMFQMWIQTYSWWFRNPVNSPVELGSLSTIIYRDFIHPRVIVWDFWIINSINESTQISLLHLVKYIKTVHYQTFRRTCATWPSPFSHCSGGSFFDLWRNHQSKIGSLASLHG